MIYATYELAIYYNLKPNEYWSMTYKEVVTYCQCKLAYDTDKLKEQIILQDNVADKMLQANPLITNHPKIESLRKVYSKLFKRDNDIW